MIYNPDYRPETTGRDVMTMCTHSPEDQHKHCTSYKKSRWHDGCIHWRQELGHCDNVQIQHKETNK